VAGQVQLTGCLEDGTCATKRVDIAFMHQMLLNWDKSVQGLVGVCVQPICYETDTLRAHLASVDWRL
jgi:hypothetical protein